MSPRTPPTEQSTVAARESWLGDFFGETTITRQVLPCLARRVKVVIAPRVLRVALDAIHVVRERGAVDESTPSTVITQHVGKVSHHIGVHI
jgi:hypothetical protein